MKFYNGYLYNYGNWKEMEIWLVKEQFFMSLICLGLELLALVIFYSIQDHITSI